MAVALIHLKYMLLIHNVSKSLTEICSAKAARFLALLRENEYSFYVTFNM